MKNSFELFLKNSKSFFKTKLHFFISLGISILLVLILLILVTLAAIETKRPTAYTDIAVKTTGNGDAFDGNSATFSTTSYDATHNPSIIYHSWTATGQVYTALDLKLTYSAQAGTNDTYAYYYSTSGLSDCSDYATRTWPTLLSPTSAGASETTLTQTLSASQDLTQLCIKIATVKTTSPDNKSVYTHEIWTEGTYTINNPPSATTPTSITQATNGSGYITFQTTLTDSDSNETRLKVEYSDNGGSTWYDPDLVSATPDNGAVDMDDANTYQVGTADGIDTDNFGSITLTVVWDTKSALNGGGSLDGTDQSDIQIRITPYDGIANGTTQASSNFLLDNLSPTVTDANISIAGGTGTGGAYKIGDTITVTWNNSAGGDNNSGLSTITANLFSWGGSSTATMTDTTTCGGTASDNIYEACYTIVGIEGKDADNQNVSVIASDSFGNSATTADTTNAKIDTINPTGLTALVAGATGSTIQTLNWTAVTETSFDHYEIWYGTSQSNVQNRTASEWDNSDDVNLATRTTTATTITGLSPSTTYYFKIWAIDDVGNEETVADINTTTTAPANNPPSATTPSSISQYTNGSGYISFQTTVSDADFNNTKLKVEYSDDGGGTWKDPDLISSTPSSGTVDLDDANPYQIGTINTIDTSGGSVTLTIVWDTKSALNDGGSSNLDNLDQSDIQIRVIPNDGTVNGSASASTNFSVDNLDPSGLTALTAGATGTTTQVLNWSTVTENNFDHYEIWYSTSQSDVQGRTGTAAEWDNIDDSNLSTISTTTTTITGLSSSTLYYFKIWAIDDFGNEQTVSDINTTTGSGNSAPSATTPFSITQATNGSGYITFSTTISDPDSNETKLKIEYSDNGGSTWYDPDLISATPNNGAIDLNDANAYQIGTSDGIDTDGFGSVTLVIVWDTKSALNGSGSLDGIDQSDIKIRVTPNDGSIDGSASASANFSVDNLDPNVTAANVFIRSDTCTGTGGACKNGDFPVLRWDGNLDGETDTIVSATFNGSQLKSTDSALSGSNLVLNIWETLLTGSLDSQEDTGNTISVTVTDDVGNSTGPITSSISYVVDTIIPTAPGNLVDSGTKTSTSITLNFGTSGSDGLFEEYKIFYKAGSGGVTESDNDWTTANDVNLGFINYNGATSTTVTGLNASINYFFNIWIYDAVGNKANATEIGPITTNSGNSAPSATTPSSITQATNSSGYITFSANLTDIDSNETKLKVEYSDNGGITWYDPDLVSATPNNGAVDLNDANAYQVGTLNGIDTDNFASVILTIVWDTKSASNGNGSLDNTNQSDIKIRIIPNDGIIDGSASASANFSVDNLDPTGLTALASGTTTSTTQILNWSVVTENNFDHYEIWYGINQTDVQNRAGTAAEWDNIDDAALSTISTATTTIIGLTENTTYYYKIWAVDDFGNEEMVADISKATSMSAAPLPPTYISLPPEEEKLEKEEIVAEEIIYDYEYIFQSANPILNAGETATLTLNIKNTGNVSWNKSGMKPTRLGTSHPNDRISSFYHSSWLTSNRVALKQDSVAPGETGTFEFTILSPSNIKPDIYKEYFTPVIEGITWMKDVGIYWEITIGKEIPLAEKEKEISYGFYTVQPGDTLGKIAVKLSTTVDRLIELNKDIFPVLLISRNVITVGWKLKYDLPAGAEIEKIYDYEYISQSPYLTLNPGETAVLTLTLKNIGNVPWHKSESSPLRLGTSNPQDRTSVFYHSSWLSPNRITLKEDTVEPGELGTFEFFIQAPTDLQSGTYKEYFTPVVDGVAWMKDIGIYWEIKTGEEISQEQEIILVNYGFYTVRPGDSLSRIAKELNITTQKLIELNSDKYPTLLITPGVIAVGWEFRYELLPAAVSNLSISEPSISTEEEALEYKKKDESAAYNFLIKMTHKFFDDIIEGFRSIEVK